MYVETNKHNTKVIAVLIRHESHTFKEVCFLDTLITDFWAVIFCHWQLRTSVEVHGFSKARDGNTLKTDTF